MVNGLLANIGIEIVRLSCSSSLAKEVPVPIGCATDSVFLCVTQKGLPWEGLRVEPNVEKLINKNDFL